MEKKPNNSGKCVTADATAHYKTERVTLLTLQTTAGASPARTTTLSNVPGRSNIGAKHNEKLHGRNVMPVTRRTFSAMLASAVAAPRAALAQARNNCAFYSGVGGQLTHYEVDFDAATLAKRAAVTLPGGIQYALPHPSRRHLYVATSSGGVGIAPVPGYPPDQQIGRAHV